MESVTQLGLDAVEVRFSTDVQCGPGPSFGQAVRVDNDDETNIDVCTPDPGQQDILSFGFAAGLAEWFGGDECAPIRHVRGLAHG